MPIVKGTNVIRRGDLPRKVINAEIAREVAAAHAVVTARNSKPPRENGGMRQTGLGYRQANWSAFKIGASSAEVQARAAKSARADFAAYIKTQKMRLVEGAAAILAANPKMSEADAFRQAQRKIIESKRGISPAALNAEKSAKPEDFHFSPGLSAPGRSF